ncbi:MAG TPA: glycoside hydrolase, partial [Pyrinomonadaceae bacterium]|nr:glycoside hydrolase [Pyrinomonadaceae bacterium]
RDDWPVIGVDADGDGKGEPVLTYRKPNVGREYPSQAPATSDEFSGTSLSLQWQWHANPVAEWSSFSKRRGWLRLAARQRARENLWAVPNLLLQKLPAREFTVTTLIDASGLREGERSGLLMMGRDYSYLAVVRSANGLRVVRVTCLDAPKNSSEKELGAAELKTSRVVLRLDVNEKAECRFSYSIDGKRFDPLGGTFIAQPGMWIGAKVGLFAEGTNGYADFDWFRMK